MLLSLATPSGRRSALPLVTRTLPQAELLHRSIVSRVGKGRRVHCPELTGRDDEGRPLRGGHRHAHILPINLRGDAEGTPRLDHVLIHAPMGLSGPAQQAIRTLRETWTKRGVDLQVAFAGSGDLDVLRSLPAPFDRQVTRLLGPPGGSRVWQSLTPFVPPRFIKPRGINSLLGQINAELGSRGIDPVGETEILPAETIALRHFVRVRQRGGTPPPCDTGFALRLTFSRPVLGPLSLGYASHFGLGLFGSCDR
ncbi:MAG: type I-U CRISPR-associated protein Csb2 [Pirellulaceae bacterium]